MSADSTDSNYSNLLLEDFMTSETGELSEGARLAKLRAFQSRIYHAGFVGARNTAILEQLKVSVEDFNGMMGIAGGKIKIEKASSIGAYKRQAGDILEQSFKSDSEISRVLNQKLSEIYTILDRL
jgi:hypothetical protein